MPGNDYLSRLRFPADELEDKLLPPEPDGPLLNTLPPIPSSVDWPDPSLLD